MLPRHGVDGDGQGGVSGGAQRTRQTTVRCARGQMPVEGGCNSAWASGASWGQLRYPDSTARPHQGQEHTLLRGRSTARDEVMGGLWPGEGVRAWGERRGRVRSRQRTAPSRSQSGEPSGSDAGTAESGTRRDGTHHGGDPVWEVWSDIHPDDFSGDGGHVAAGRAEVMRTEMRCGPQSPGGRGRQAGAGPTAGG